MNLSKQETIKTLLCNTKGRFYTVTTLKDGVEVSVNCRGNLTASASSTKLFANIVKLYDNNRKQLRSFNLEKITSIKVGTLHKF
jgi:hypothetical protein